MTDTPKNASAEKNLRVRRGRVDSVDIFEIKDSELDLFEKGSPSGIYLNFSIFLLSISFSSLIALCTTSTFKYAIIQTAFVVITVVGILGGSLLLILWSRSRKDVAAIIRKIRNRIPPDIESAPPGEQIDEICLDDFFGPTSPKS